MKLNPPASSSDLEAAREIARRLHQRRRRADFDRNADRRDFDAPAAEFPAARPAPRPFAPATRSTPATRPGAEPPSPPAAAPWSAGPPAPDEPEPPSWDDNEGAEGTADDGHLAGALGDLTDEGEAGGEAAAEPEGAGPEPALPSFDEDEQSMEAPPPPELPGVDIEVEDAGVSPDEMVGEAAAGEAEAEVFDEPLAGSAFDAPPPPETEEPAAALGSEEELFDEPPPPPPSWDDVVEACREIASASGAMIIDPAGQVFAARGEWPDPGPDAIAGRLVAMMERTLKDAPTRSVSAPVGGQHLTAWRVPLAEGLVTAAFIADTPLRSDVRSAIDAEILRGAGA